MNEAALSLGMAALIFAAAVISIRAAVSATVGEVMEADSDIRRVLRRAHRAGPGGGGEGGGAPHRQDPVGPRGAGHLEYATSGQFDMMVIGFMGLSSLYDRIWGSTSQNLTRLSPCTVMVVK